MLFASGTKQMAFIPKDMRNMSTAARFEVQVKAEAAHGNLSRAHGPT